MKLQQAIIYLESIITTLKKSTENNDKFRIRNYQKWISILKDLAEQDEDQYEFTCEDEINALDISDKCKHKLIELMTTGKIGDYPIPTELSNNIIQSSNPEPELPKPPELINFYGFGPSTITKYETMQITGQMLLDEWKTYTSIDPSHDILMWSKMSKPDSITDTKWNCFSESQKIAKLHDDLYGKLELHTKYLVKLNYHQLIGVKHYYNISQKIPRKEMEKIEKIILTIGRRLNPELKITICGSYRRGRMESGDIDTFISHPNITDDNKHEDLLAKVVTILTNLGFLVDHLTENGTTKYMGLCQIPNSIPRRIDIRVIPFQSYAFATLYFTGSKNNNTIMRNKAKKMGYTLNEYGLYKLEDHKPVICQTEEEIFKVLDMPYLTPQQRDI